MDKALIYQKMRELEIKIHYHFNDIAWLAKAMRSEKIEGVGGKNHSEYTNEGLATVGDTLLKSVLADYLYRNDVQTKGEITCQKSALENNEVMHKIMIEHGLIGYAYNDKHFQADSNIPEHEKVVNKEHDPYIEAMIGAVFYDSNYDTTKRWILKWLLPLLKHFSKPE